MKRFFDGVTRLSLNFRWVTLGAIVIVMVLGGIAGSRLKQELLPPIEFPQTFILAQVSGMSSEQVLSVVTERLEASIGAIPDIVNLSSTSSSAIGAVITAANEFGNNQSLVTQKIQNAIDTVWFPQRAIRTPEGIIAQDFSADLLNKVTPEMAVYLAQESSNFAFELSPKVWELLSIDTVQALLGTLATQTTSNEGSKSGLQRLVEQEIVPQIQTLGDVANVQITGGQALPGQEALFAASVSESGEKSFLLQLSPDVWRVIQARIPDAGALDSAAVERFTASAEPVVISAPALPTEWLAPHFSSVDDLLELESLTRTVGRIFNDFVDSGEIVGSLGQTDDLTADDLTQLLTLDPTLVNALTSEQLAALSPELLALLPSDYLDSLDGLTRDALAASAIARAINGDQAIVPVDLPSAWRIQPPQIITFSLASIPLVTYSVFSDATPVNTDALTTPIVEAPVTTSEVTNTVSTPPVGPALPALFNLIGAQFGATLDTADDLLDVKLSGAIAEQFGVTSIRGADLLNQLASSPSFGSGSTEGGQGFDIAAFAQALPECGFGLLDIDLQNPNVAALVIGCLKPDAFSYLMTQDNTFVASLSRDVYPYLSEDVLALDGVTPPLPDVWNTLSQQVTSDAQPLQSVGDLVALSDGNIAELLNNINTSIPVAFSGYEARLFDSLETVDINAFLKVQPDFWTALDANVLLKLSPEVIATIPDAVLTAQTAANQTLLADIASGSKPSAAQEVAARYAVDADVTPTDPNAPALDPLWGVVASNAPGVDQLLNASDLLRLPADYGSAAQFINVLFNRASDFAGQIIGTLSVDAVDYIATRDASFLTGLDVRALKALSAETFASLPQDIQDRANADTVFVPTGQLTRTNGAPALLITVTKDQTANTVEAYYAVKKIVDDIDANNPNISVAVAFEQSGLVESSIEGVVREGTLGAFFAVLIILMFLSGGVWGGQGRRITGIVVIVVSIAFLALVVGTFWTASESNLAVAWELSDAVFRVIGIGGIIVGFAILLAPQALPSPAWRSTLVIAVSIPLSIFAALALMHWLPPTMNGVFAPLAESSPIFSLLARLFPKELTLNIMTLSGLTVAVGRVVDDSIVVLENIFRQIQMGSMSKREAILTGTKDVSVAIFSATGITVIVFLPLGLTGGLIGEFFLPFGLAVTYALLASFVVAITVIPVLVELFVTSEEAHEEPEGGLQHAYVNLLRWTQANNLRRIGVVILAIVSALFGFVLFAGRPQAFIPDIGDPQISIALEMPAGTSMIETNEVALRAEDIVREVIPADELETLSTTVGGGGLSLASLTGGSSVSENRATITIGLHNSEELDGYTELVRTAISSALGEDISTVSKATLSSQGGFGGFELEMSANDQAALIAYEPCVLEILNHVGGVENVTSNLSQSGLGGGICPTYIYRVPQTLDDTAAESLRLSIANTLAPEKVIVSVSNVEGAEVRLSAFDAAALDGYETKLLPFLKTQAGFADVERSETLLPVATTDTNTDTAPVYIRINQRPALSFSGEITTEDTINLAPRAVAAVNAQLSLPEGMSIGQGANSQLQSEGFTGIFVAMGIAIVMVIVILILVFGSPVYWFAVIFSIMVAPVGAAIALTLTGRTLGISALIGLLMLLGLVVTNAVVLIDRVSSNRKERGMDVHDALLEAGGRRLRPILMTALATIIALMPLALGLSEGAIIAEELGTVVIGGLLSSTLLTLVVVPAVYYLVTPLHQFFVRKERDNNTEKISS